MNKQSHNTQSKVSSLTKTRRAPKRNLPAEAMDVVLRWWSTPLPERFLMIILLSDNRPAYQHIDFCQDERERQDGILRQRERLQNRR